MQSNFTKENKLNKQPQIKKLKNGYKNGTCMINQNNKSMAKKTYICNKYIQEMQLRKDNYKINDNLINSKAKIPNLENRYK